MPPFLLATVLTLASIAIAFGVVRGANLVRRTNQAWQGAADALARFCDGLPGDLARTNRRWRRKLAK